MQTHSFAGMSEDEIHMMKRDPDDDTRINKAIVDYFSSSDKYDIYQEIAELEKEEKEYSNPYAVQRIGEYYRDGVGVETSYEKYIEYLKRFVDLISDKGNYLRIAKDLSDSNYDSPLMAELSVNDWVHLSDMGSACQIIGTYLSGSNDVKTLDSAEWYLMVAYWNYSKDAKELLERLKVKKERLKNLRQVRNDLAHDSTMHNSSSIAYYRLDRAFGGLWKKLSVETQTYLFTAYLTYLLYKEQRENVRSVIDYSGVISLLMRALEYELCLFFKCEYLEFLNEKNPSTTDYLFANGFSCKKWNHRSVVLFKDDDDKVCYFEEKPFSLGIIPAYCGFKDSMKIDDIQLDKTFIEFCLSSLYCNNDHDVKQWLQSVVHNVDSLRQRRNASSHGGETLSIYDADETFDFLLWVEHMLISFIEKRK